ncbi:uncharacterized protein LOC108624572 [Ceratina calcarata]|uniref:Uncharacterized protein LOC108624572 n=1 Tax=Ceratina calcarata TaxID=156304 RepID=A0AAJ7S072_9HYME|nr:uncharacterized protein LOC108624572 [Ceratina calcarata]
MEQRPKRTAGKPTRYQTTSSDEEPQRKRRQQQLYEDEDELRRVLEEETTDIFNNRAYVNRAEYTHMHAQHAVTRPSLTHALPTVTHTTTYPHTHAPHIITHVPHTITHAPHTVTHVPQTITHAPQTITHTPHTTVPIYPHTNNSTPLILNIDNEDELQVNRRSQNAQNDEDRQDRDGRTAVCTNERCKELTRKYDVMMAMMAKTQQTVEENSRQLKQILRLMQAQQGAPTKPMCLPLSSVQEMQNFNEADETYEATVKYLVYIGGTTVREAVNLSFKEAVADSIATSYSWLGREERNLPLREARICRAIHDAVIRNKNFSRPSRKEIGDCLMVALRNAKERIRSAKSRRPEKRARNNNGDNTSDPLNFFSDASEDEL